MGVIEWPAGGAAILAGWTYHARRGGPDNAFRYGVDYVLWRLQPEATARPALLRRNGFGLLTLRDRDHGHGEGSMLAWAKAQAEGFGMPTEAMAEVWLLTQPRSLGFLFNPVSFWFFRNKDGDVRAVLAEVNNTTYTFRFDLQSDALDIVIDHRRGNQGLVATLSGALQPAGLRQLVAMIARRPLGALRVYALIHWQAVKLKLKGARYRVRPPPPQEEVTR